MNTDGPLVLLVESEPALRVPLAFMLRHTGFRVAEAESGLLALQEVRKLRPDLVLMEIAMPGIDGIETCRRLKEDTGTRSVPVVMLTSLSDRGTVLRAISAGAADFVVKSQFEVDTFKGRLTKVLHRRNGPGSGGTPAPEAMVQAAPDAAPEEAQADTPAQPPARSLAQRKESTRRVATSVLDDLLAKVGDLEAMPFVAAELNRLVRHPETQAADVVAVLLKDQALTANLLRVANSAAYAGKRITNVHMAVVKLGFKTVGRLAMSVGIVAAFKGGSGGAFDRTAFWEHSLGCAVMARFLARLRDARTAEDCFVLGLLHDLGKAVLDEHVHEDFQEAVRTAAENGEPLKDVEKRLLGIDHKMLGRKLAERWKLPEGVGSAAYYHGEPWERIGQIAKDERRACVLVKTANLLAKALQWGNSGDDHIEEIPDEFLDELGVHPRRLEAAVPSLESEVTALTMSLVGDMTNQGSMGRRDRNSRRAQRSLLVVEPREFRSLVVSMALGAAGYPMKRCTPSEAVATVRNDKPDLILALAPEPADAGDNDVRALCEWKDRPPLLQLVHPDCIKQARARMASGDPEPEAMPVSLAHLLAKVDAAAGASTGGTS